MIFSLYNYKTSENDLIINFDILCNWLSMRKDVLKRTLERTYTKDIDYKLNIIKLSGKGRPYEEIFITPDCMKRICMLSTTEKAEEVRTYFIKIEKLLDKYKEIIIDDLNKKIDILERNQKPKVNPSKGVIYVVKTSKTIEDMFKIGKSKKFLKRLLSHNSVEPDDIEIIMLYETDNIKQVEKCVKNALLTKQYRKRKEIYQVDVDIIKEVIESCDNIINKVNKTKKSKKLITILDNKIQQKFFMLFIEKKDNTKLQTTKKTTKKLSKKISKTIKR